MVSIVLYSQFLHYCVWAISKDIQCGNHQVIPGYPEILQELCTKVSNQVLIYTTHECIIYYDSIVY
jgi:hypothetical protein